MNHRPFEEWLLDDRLLDPAQKRELDAHLHSCDTCSAVAESNLVLRSARVIGPAPGFAARFQERLVLARRAQRRRTFLGTLFFSSGGLLLLAILAGPTITSLIGSPAEWLSALVRTLLFLYTTIMAVTEASFVIFQVLPGFVPTFIWLVLISALCGLGLLSSVSIWRLTRRTQGVQA